MVEPTEILARLQAARKAFEQRDFELSITHCDYIIANAEGSSEEAKEAKELRRHASEHELLGKIAEASVFNAAIPLIEQAIQKKKLRYDLDGKPLKRRWTPGPRSAARKPTPRPGHCWRKARGWKIKRSMPRRRPVIRALPASHSPAR